MFVLHLALLRSCSLQLPPYHHVEFLFVSVTVEDRDGNLMGRLAVLAVGERVHPTDIRLRFCVYYYLQES